MIKEMDDLTERCTHAYAMRFSAEDAERLTYLELAYAVFLEERAAIRKENLSDA
jgi:hypothetical protein